MAAYVWLNLDRDYKAPLYEQKVDVAIRCINPDMLENAIHEALFKLNRSCSEECSVLGLCSAWR